jgi:hypothetical protein
VIDELLPEVTTEALAALMQRDEEQRPVEGISWELKSEVSKNRIPPDRLCVRQYARRHPDPRGEAAREADQWICRPGRRGRLGDDSREHDSRRCVPLAGLVPDRSPLPREAGAPGLVVKVPRSTRTPHIHLASGHVYARTWDGTSEPIKDQATLTRLLDQGRGEDEAATMRLDVLARDVPTSRSSNDSQWQLGLIATPLPYGAYRARGLFTTAGFDGTTALFRDARLVQQVSAVGCVTMESGSRAS